MNKTIIWVVIAILVVGGVYLLFGRKTKPADNQSAGTSASNTTSATKDTSTAPASGPQSLTDLLALGTSQKCSFNDASNSGNFYLSGDKARGDFTTTADGKATKTHMIMENQTSYIWVDGQSQGFKMSAAPAQQTSPAASQTPQGVDANKKMDYSCQTWTADSSMFTMPAGIQFMDLSSLQPKQ